MLSGIGVCESGAAVRVSPAGVRRRRALPQPELQQTAVSKNGSDQDGDARLGPQNQTGPQKGQSEMRTSLSKSVHQVMGVSGWTRARNITFDQSIANFIM